MVSWQADGTMAGYDPVTKRLKKGLFHFGSPGSVDLNGVMRLNYAMGSGLNLTTYPNALQIVAPLTFSAADFSNNSATTVGGPEYLTACVIVVRASEFPAGHVPTPKEIFDLPESKFAYASRANTVVYGTGTFSQVFEIPHFNAEWYWNTKWWVLVYPAKTTNHSGIWSKKTDGPMVGANINTVGRALSIYSNRTPAKPTIISPVSGSIAQPGTEFTLRLNPADPDEMTPEDAAKYNDDVNGVEFQYREAPTAENPNPEWSGLPFDWESLGVTLRDDAWHIRGSRNWAGLAATPYHEALVANLGCPVIAGAGSGAADYRPGKAALPTGNWQIRGRTFDYGHPYPNSGTNPNEPGPLGINPANNWLNEPANQIYPEQNRSPWSDPVSISIPAQVPPPVPLYPKDDLAVADNIDSIALRWRYRNTHVPPRDQYKRTVQIRKVGDPLWSTIFSGVSGNPSVNLPFSLTQVIVPPMEVMPDSTSEGGTTSGWFNDNNNRPTAISNVNDPTKAHNGNRYVRFSNTGLTRANEYTDDYSFSIGDTNGPLTDVGIKNIPEVYSDFEFDAWFHVDASTPLRLQLTALWVDAVGNPIWGTDPDRLYDSPYVVSFLSKSFSGAAQWRRMSDLVPDINFSDDPYGDFSKSLGSDPARLTLERPAGGAALYFGIVITRNTAAAPFEAGTFPPLLTSELRLDDVTVTATAPGLDDFAVFSTNQYEWRVSAVDTDGIQSGYSPAARFWVVPGGGSGVVRPIPEETIDGATLGCGTHTVQVFRRGGKVLVGTLTNVSYVDWGRVRDDMSTAQIKVSGWDIDCGNLLAKLQTWAYELVIWRDDGYSIDRVWEGPITLLTYEIGKVTIDAKDVMGYAYRRIIKQRMTDSGKGNGTTVVDRARRVIQNAFAPDDPNILAYLQVLAQEDDAMQYRSTPAYSRTAFEEVDDMAANAGLDYTALGRSILLWGTKHRIGTLPELRDEDLGASPIVSEYGMSMANVYSVSDGNGVHGEATRGLDPVTHTNEDYGLVEMLSSTWASDSEDDSGTYTQAGLATVIESFENFAERSIADRYPPPVVVRIPDNTSLSPDAPISIQHLVPGVAVPLRSTGTLRTVRALQKLDSIKVVEEKGVETVSITLSPFSRDDTTLVEGDAGA